VFGNVNVTQDDTFLRWLKDKTSLCEDGFLGFAHLFAKLNNVTVNPSFSAGPPGGEQIQSVINRPERDEFLIVKPGYYQIPCQNKKIYQYSYESGDHLNKWMSILRPTLEIMSSEFIPEVTIAVTRYEYANIYHTMTDWYNAYLMLLFFNIRNLSAKILFVDSHPQGGLDSIWTTLFGEFIRAGQLKKPKRFNTLIWNIQGYKSPMYHHELPSVPFIESFRRFFLGKHNVPSKKTLNCKKLSILFIWRRDYVAHPRNPKGIVSRKVKNEEELENLVHKLYPNHSISSIQTDKMSMHDQLSAIVNTDILIGMHGAGLTLALFLPEHAGLVEIYPKYWSSDNAHFRAIARWRNLQYRRWQNIKSENEFSKHYTYIPPRVIQDLLSETVEEMCEP
jgi:glycoprotein 2-beta-D-xylosyltransferase